MQAAYTRSKIPTESGKNFHVINVMNDTPEVVARLAKERRSNTLFVADPEKKIRNQYGVPRVPSSFLVDRDDEVASIIVQFSSNSLNQMSAQVATLVKLPAQVIVPVTLAARTG